MSVEAIRNFFNQQEFDAIYQYCMDIFKNPNQKYRLNFMCWQPEIVGDSAPILIHDIVGEHKINLIDTPVERLLGQIPTKAMLYLGTNGSHIKWHTDEHVVNAGTLYLNDVWDKEWGGLYQYEENGKIETIIPEQNLFLLQNNGTMHATTPIHSKSPARVTIQMFFDKD